MRYLSGVLRHDKQIRQVWPRDAAGRCSSENRKVPLQLLVVSLVGVAAGQDHGSGEAAGFDPGHELLSEPLGFVL